MHISLFDHPPKSTEPHGVDVFWLDLPNANGKIDWPDEALIVDLASGETFLRDNNFTVPLNRKQFQGKPYFDVDADAVRDPVYLTIADADAQHPARAYLFAKPSRACTTSTALVNGDYEPDELLADADEIRTDPRFASQPGLADVLHEALGVGSVVLFTGQDSPILKNTWRGQMKWHP